MARCKICRRTLKSAASIRLGMGQGCARKHAGHTRRLREEGKGQLCLFTMKARPWDYVKAKKNSCKRLALAPKVGARGNHEHDT